MNKNRHLAVKTYGARQVQPHQPRKFATKKKKLTHPKKEVI